MAVSFPEWVDQSFEDFLSSALAILDEVETDLGALLMSALPEGRWHPNGFQVFPILDVPGIGIVRVHVWPKGPRMTRQGHPVVHTHVFHLYSRVLAGEYRETLFDVAESDGGANSWEGWRVSPPTGDGFDRIELEAVRYLVSPRGGLARYGSAQSHAMPAGSYHSTSIPRGGDCITLALLSRPVPGFSDHLVGGRSDTARVSERSRVEAGHLEWVQDARLRTALRLT
ncbi:hypothetical protein GCM10027039_08350 [Terrabacter koreensis]